MYFSGDCHLRMLASMIYNRFTAKDKVDSPVIAVNGRSDVCIVDSSWSVHVYICRERVAAPLKMIQRMASQLRLENPARDISVHRGVPR